MEWHFSLSKAARWPESGRLSMLPLVDMFLFCLSVLAAVTFHHCRPTYPRHQRQLNNNEVIFFKFTTYNSIGEYWTVKSYEYRHGDVIIHTCRSNCSICVEKNHFEKKHHFPRPPWHDWKNWSLDGGLFRRQNSHVSFRTINSKPNGIGKKKMDKQPPIKVYQNRKKMPGPKGVVSKTVFKAQPQSSTFQIAASTDADTVPLGKVGIA